MLLHGWPRTWYEWRHVIELLAGEYQLVVPDLRGFGYSAKPAAGYDADTMAADLAALSDHLDLRDVTVLGHDWGAVFAYVYAAKTPSQVRALGIVEMALPGVGIMEQAMAPQPQGNFLWHMGFQSVPDLPELLIAGKEKPYLRWFFEHFAYDPGAITAADLDVYTDAITQVGALRAGLARAGSAASSPAATQTPASSFASSAGDNPCRSGGSPRSRSQASTSAAVTANGVAGRPAARARAGLRCCDGHIDRGRISGKNGGTASAGTGMTSTSLPATCAQVAIRPAIVVGSAGPTA